MTCTLFQKLTPERSGMRELAARDPDMNLDKQLSFKCNVTSTLSSLALKVSPSSSPPHCSSFLPSYLPLLSFLPIFLSYLSLLLSKLIPPLLSSPPSYPSAPNFPVYLVVPYPYPSTPSSSPATLQGD